MATRGPVSTEVDSPLAQAGNPTPEKVHSGVDGQGFRPLGMATPGPAAVDTTMSLGPARPIPGLTGQGHSNVAHQLSPLQQHGGVGQAGGHFAGSHTGTLPAHLSPHFGPQRQPQHGAGAGGTPRQHPQMGSGGLGPKVSRSHVEVRRRTPQDGGMESRAHPVVTRPVANMGQPVQGSPAGLGGSQLGKPQLMLHRPQGSPQEKGGQIQKPTASAQRQVIQRAHTRTAGWQTPLGQHTPGTPSGQSRMFYPHPVLNAQARSSPQEQGRQHPVAAVAPQQYSQQQPLRDGGPAGVKSLPIYPVMRTPVAGNHTNNHNDTAYRERPVESPIVVHIGDRKVRLVSESDPSSLYSLCRRWVRNEIPRADQRSGVRDVMNIPSLPRPSSVAEIESAGDYALDNGTKSDPDQCQPEIEKPVDSMTDEELLQSHIQHFKGVRRRSREERMRRIARYKPRLALLLPESG
ncbi:hypothetical protein KC19_8G116300 [Ceratodon purpureus]|uniref:Uncharacterized protein n=1 Tax=Ceratodon purpureus TaxID=3225 RepID=A0A8T0GXL5_CERPU|nr:hypothetical protein KC19_8G116300 [Ceratodon purpureus]